MTLERGNFIYSQKFTKKGCPGRPVISGCNTPTEQLSEFVDAQLKPLVPRIASYAQDSNDMLRKLKDMERLPENVILVTIDVVGLYPHIPHEEGLQAIRRALDQREEQGIPTEDIVDLASIVLKNINFVLMKNILFKSQELLSELKWHRPTQIYSWMIWEGKSFLPQH